MPSNHIFTVNAQTFNVHLNYMFAGTGKDGSAHQAGALADILGVRPGDNLVFYVEKYGFYGFFQAKSSDGRLVFYEPSEDQYLDQELGGKTLTYRVFIEPSRLGVFRYGVPEWDATENPINILEQKVFHMQWSWIFKKLKGGRGCTSIPKEEFELLKGIIDQGNERLPESERYGFNNGEVVPIRESFEYKGDTSRSPFLHSDAKTIITEDDLRIFFSANAGLNHILDVVLRPEDCGRIVYIANETKCSFGLRSIDLLFVTEKNKCLLIELKNKYEYNEKLLNQIITYSRWISSYKNYLHEIVPILILREPRLYPSNARGYLFKYLSKDDCKARKVSTWYRDIVSKIDELRVALNNANIDKLSALQAYEFHTDDNNTLLSFSRLGNGR